MAGEMLTLQIPADKLGPRARQVAQIAFSNPNLSQNQIALQVGVKPSRISAIFNSPRFLEAIRGRSKNALAAYIPLATGSMQYCMKQNRALDVKLRASTRLLEEQGIIGKESSTVTVNQFSGLSTEEIRNIVQKAKEIPPPVIEAHIE